MRKPSEELLEEFLSVKRLEGRSEKMLLLYKFNISKILKKSDKNVCVMNTNDIRKYLSEYQLSGVSKATVDNVRCNLSSFFRWLEDESYIYKSPLRRIHKIKTTSVVIETYADEDLEKLRDDCREIRNPHRRLKAGGVDTTLHYAMVKQSNVKLAHKKYMG
jgi:site-specific recombinase XerD